MICEKTLERFRQACGLGVPLTMEYRGEDDPPTAADTPLDSPGPFVLIGRHPRADLSLDSPRVSRRHAYLQAVAGRVVVVDLKSRTKTFWEDRSEPQPWGWLESNQSIRIGPYRIQRTDRQPEGPRPPLDPFSPDDDASDLDRLPRPVFELPFRVGGVASTWEMPGLLALVGRTDDCQFMLSDESVSRTHACLVRTALGVWVVDLAGREGVRINGTRVRWAWLADGDLVRFGLFTMVLRYDRPPADIRREDIPLEAGAMPERTPEDRRRVAPQRAEGTGRELAVRPAGGSPRVNRTSGPLPAGLPAAPAVVDRGEWEPAFGPGPSPYAMWQQQMQLMETFHNDMAMMVQMFIAMHREFQGSVRSELERVQKLTRELGRLNSRLTQLEKPAGTGPAENPDRRGGNARPVRRPDPSGPDSVPRTRVGLHAGSSPRPDVKGDGNGSNDADRPSTVSPDPDTTAANPRPTGEPAQMYADLTRRITELQRQRRGYWQRILKRINR